MIDLAQGEELLQQTISRNLRHADYDRVVKLADEYRKLFTGEDIDTLLRQFARREDKAMFEQRKALYQSVMPAVANNLSNVFKKPLRSNRVWKDISGQESQPVDEVNKAVLEFWKGDSSDGVDAYLQTRWFDLAKLDPNAFIAVEFDSFDANTEKAKPYPVEFSSTEAVNYEYRNGVLQYLICQRPIKYEVRTGKQIQKKDGHRYIMYLENEALVYVQVDFENPVLPEGITADQTVAVGDGKDRKRFIRYTYEPNSGMVPAVRVGVEPDSVTKSRTCVSIFHSAVPFFKKELKAGSELDISMALHAFPQKIQYGKRCEGDKAKGVQCKDGKTVNGDTCPVCNGTMVAPVQTSGQDAMIIPFPARSDVPLLELDKLMVYKSPSIDLIKFQDDYVDRLTEKARKAVFGGTTMVQKSGLKTATEADYAMEDVYDALYDFSRKYSSVWLFLVELIAVYTDNAEKVKVYHRFPTDFKMKSLQQLFEERKAAKDSGAPESVLAAIDNDIMELQYADDKDTLFKLKVRESFLPFRGKSPADVLALITAGKTTAYFETLYNHFSVVFENIEEKLGDKFYLLTREKQLAEVKAQVTTIQQEMSTERAARMPIPIEKADGVDDEDNNPDDDPDEQ